MITAKDIYGLIEALAPTCQAAGWDNVGLLAGRMDAPVTRVLVALDVTGEVVEEARQIGASLIISHHPMFFALKKVSGDAAEPLLRLIENGMAAICMHTNLDAASGGVNDVLARVVGLSDVVVFGEDDPRGLGRAGLLKEPENAADLARRLKQALNAPGARLYDAGKPIKRLALCSGAGSSLFEAAASLGCDAFLSGELKYDVYLQARSRGISLLELGHFATEDVICQSLVEQIKRAFPRVEAVKSALHRDFAEYI